MTALAIGVGTFRRWIGQQRHRNDPVGDLARDVLADPGDPVFPSLAEWVDYLGSIRASDRCHVALVQAWREFARQSPVSPRNRKPPRRLRYDYTGPNPRSISPTTRQLVFERDDFRCRRCGSGPRDRRLEVDHIQPVALDGTNDLSNLQTLCELCNAGKAGRPPHAHDQQSDGDL